MLLSFIFYGLSFACETLAIFNAWLFNNFPTNYRSSTPMTDSKNCRCALPSSSSFTHIKLNYLCSKPCQILDILFCSAPSVTKFGGWRSTTVFNLSSGTVDSFTNPCFWRCWLMSQVAVHEWRSHPDQYWELRKIVALLRTQNHKYKLWNMNVSFVNLISLFSV